MNTSTMQNWSDNNSITGESSYGNQSGDTTDLVATICNQYIGPFLCVFGVFGNIMNLIILFKGNLNEPPYLYLKALAMTDMGALCFSLIHLTASSRSTLYGWKFYDAYIFFPIVNFFTATSVWLTVGVTIDRFVYVKSPLWARTQCSIYKAKTRIAFILISTTIITIPRYFCFILNGHDDKYKLQPTTFRSSKNYRIYDITCIALFHMAPLVIFISTNTYLIYAVHRARSVRREFNIRNNKEKDWSQEQRRFTITLISIVLLSIIAILPSTIGDFTRFLNIPFAQYHKLRHSSNMLLLCNLSMNFLLYCAFNKRFVRVLRSIFSGSYIRVKSSIRRASRTTRWSRSETNIL